MTKITMLKEKCVCVCVYIDIGLIGKEEEKEKGMQQTIKSNLKKVSFYLYHCFSLYSFFFFF